jgi:uncharacterized protein (DUF1800 family)
MRHVTSELCAKFVADDPPPGCIDAGVEAWERTDGDIRSVLRAIFCSPEFLGEATSGSKTKTPLEFVVSAVRALDGTPDSTPRLARVLQRLGQPLFFQSAPTGYPETSEDWVNGGALVDRMNIAMAFAAGRIRGVTLDLDAVAPLTGDVTTLVEAVNANILGGLASPNTLRVIAEQAEVAPGPRIARTLAVGLALGSPEFQRQ